MDVHTLLYLTQITNKDLLHSTGHLLNVLRRPGWGAVWGERADVCVWASCSAVRLR